MTPRLYYRQLLWCALQRARASETASALRDRAIGLALEHGAEPADVSGLTPAVTTAALRWLLDAGRIEADGSQRNARHGRAESTYRLLGAEAEMRVPVPPRPRPPSMEIAAIRERARRQETALDFYEAFAKDAARLLVSVERLLKDLRMRHGAAYTDFTQGEPCED